MAEVRKLDPDGYISQRVKQYQDWYDKKAVRCKSWYLRMRAFSVIAGGIVPVLVNIHPFKIGELEVTKVVVTVLSLLVVIAVSLESVLHYREQWKNYRSTEQLLGHEVYWFTGRVGKYKDLSDDEAFRLFVERIEDAVAAENAATLNVMTTATEAAQDSGPKAKV